MSKYEIRVRGVLDPIWRPDFAGFQFEEVANESGRYTVLSGPALDQSALHGYLSRIRDLGLELESVRKLPDE